MPLIVITSFRRTVAILARTKTPSPMIARKTVAGSGTAVSVTSPVV